MAVDYNNLIIGDIHKDKDKIFKTNKEGNVLANKNLVLTIPEIYKTRGFVKVMPDYMEIVAIGTLIDVDTNTAYNLSSPVFMRCQISRIESFKHQDEPYIEYGLDKGSVFLMSKTLIKTPTIVPQVLKVMLWNSFIPPWYGVDSIRAVLTRMKKFTTLAIDSSPSILETLIALTRRDKKTSKLIRYTDVKDIQKDDIVYKGLDDRAYSTEHPFRMYIGGHEGRTYPVLVTKEPTTSTIVERRLR